MSTPATVHPLIAQHRITVVPGVDDVLSAKMAEPSTRHDPGPQWRHDGLQRVRGRRRARAAVRGGRAVQGVTGMATPGPQAEIRALGGIFC
jgi:hypothetical protein